MSTGEAGSAEAFAELLATAQALAQSNAQLQAENQQLRDAIERIYQTSGRGPAQRTQFPRGR